MDEDKGTMFFEDNNDSNSLPNVSDNLEDYKGVQILYTDKDGRLLQDDEHNKEFFRKIGLIK
jgi:hypothetical protein